MKQKEKSIGLNAILNIIKNLTAIIVPLISYPYVTRILLVDNLGKVNYVQSIISYFALIASLGISTYAVREGARYKNDKNKLTTFISEVFSFNIATTVIAYITLALFMFISTSFRQYWLLLLIQSLTILFTTIGVDWINVIFEDYLYITLRSIAIQLLSLVCIFLFVKSTDDYVIYLIILVACNGLVSFLNLVHVSKYVTIKMTTRLNVKKHVQPILVLFSNSLAVSIYLNADTTMIGSMVGEYYVGLYSVAVKIYSIIKQLIASLYTVIVARMSLYYAEGRKDEFQNLLNSVVNAIIFVSIPASIGLCLISKEIIIILSGSSFSDATKALQILSFAFLFAILGGVLANCINLPLKREKKNLVATSASAVINIVLNLVFIPVFKQNGAALTTLISEISVCIILFCGLKENKKIFNLKLIIENLIKCIISTVPMFILWLTIERYFSVSSIVFILIMVAFSSLTYILMNLILKNKCFYELKNMIYVLLKRKA